MTNTIHTRRVAKAKKAMDAAKNPDFKDYWRRVAQALERSIEHD